MKPLVHTQEKGMLLQAPLGQYTSFLYENAELIDHMCQLTSLAKLGPAKVEQYMDDLHDKSSHGKRMTKELHMAGGARQNRMINGVFASIMEHFKHGVKGVKPDETMADAMALTEANYDSTEFKMPYDNIVLEIPDGCVGKLSGNFEDNPHERQLMEDFGIDPECIKKGFDTAYVFISFEDHKRQYVKEFDGYAEATINVEIVTRQFISGKLIRDSEVPNIFNYPMNFNPAPVCVYSRPLIEGHSMEDILTLKTGRVGNSPGEYGVSDEGGPFVENWQFLAGSEYEYIIRLTRMAVNCIHAITQIGFDEEKQPVAKKLIKRGSHVVRRFIPDILTPVTSITNEASKAEYADDSTGHSGVVVSPHFRRGHWRKQRHGEGRKLTKTIWIAPQVINKHLLREKADENVVKNTRREK